MRLKKTNESVILFSMIMWEEEELTALARQGCEWVRFSSMGKQQRILGKIHTKSLEIQLEQGIEIQDRQMVVLGPVESSRGEVKKM
ncbi:transcriptional regulator [Ktedonobacter robiniae]|uniref:Uncharacterized protein n=1 Tax=Ktedonobacter robiniae TaxID=2778365 RepID=A0ABQ3V188_9CHLR|nr:transcriptional regulator [Ktedonobacter robiniae]GHO58683.1 hypothetical protein KSB_71580 [Ktedonobacter robiniae]